MGHNDDILFSVIVPVYNTERYIGECLKSILSQTEKNFEIIVIDDGSSDNSLRICQNFEEKDKRVKVISQENGGVSSARNKGIEIAKGEYILFVDSDDYCNHNMLEMVRKKVEPAALISFGFKKIYRNKEVLFCENSFTDTEKCKIEEKVMLNSNIGGYICNKVFSTRIIRDNNILFDTSVLYSEDLKFTMKYVSYIEKLIYIDMVPYNYRMRKSSASFNFFNKKNASILKVYEFFLKEYFYNENIVNKYKFLYLVNYYRFKYNIPSEDVNFDIVNDEKNIIRANNLSIVQAFKYHIVYKHLLIYKIVKKIKNYTEEVYL